MDLDQAIARHAEWKMKFRKAITRKEQLDTRTIQSDDACELGRWLLGPGRAAHGTLASHAECVAKHRAFHAEAGRIASAINGGKFGEAEALMANGSTYSSASNDVSTAILRLKKEAQL